MVYCFKINCCAVFVEKCEKKVFRYLVYLSLHLLILDKIRIETIFFSEGVKSCKLSFLRYRYCTTSVPATMWLCLPCYKYPKDDIKCFTSVSSCSYVWIFSNFLDSDDSVESNDFATLMVRMKILIVISWNKNCY